MISRLRATLFAAAILAGLAYATPALAAPPLPEPEIPPDPAAPGPTPPATARDPKAPPVGPPVGPPAAPPSAAKGSDAAKDSAFAPAPNLTKNPIDVLPGDVIYPPVRDKPAKPVRWDPEWARFNTADWIITGAAGAITLASAIIPPGKKHAFGNTPGIDDSGRKALRLPTTEGRYIARDGSDVILSLEATWPLFVDSLITTWWYRGSPDAAAQMALVDGETLAIVTAIQGATNTLASRERPFAKLCDTPEQPGATVDCEGTTRNRSFFSGHTAFTFMSAGLICVHHMKLDLLEGPGDVISCVTGYTAAAATGVLRVMGDMHFVTDVAVGAGVGTLVGLAVPLFHYRRANPAPQEKAGLDWTIIPVGAGAGVGGTF